jgi:protein-S-isoprenylcysteine O-methyltransferase Ste14
MSLTPVFEIGLWNAWIFMFYHQLLPIGLMSLINKGALKKSDVAAPHKKAGKKVILVIFLALIYYLTLAYSVFLPLKLGTTWFCIGLPICLIGLIMYTIVTVNFATTPLDELVTKGLYRYSRNPQYLTEILMFIGVGIASASWIFLLFSIVYSVFMLSFASSEERFCLEKYGNAYREYMNRTPRYIGVPKSGESN